VKSKTRQKISSILRKGKGRQQPDGLELLLTGCELHSDTNLEREREHRRGDEEEAEEYVRGENTLLVLADI
jgi:hypothetical protein